MHLPPQHQGSASQVPDKEANQDNGLDAVGGGGTVENVTAQPDTCQTDKQSCCAAPDAATGGLAGEGGPRRNTQCRRRVGQKVWATRWEGPASGDPQKLRFQR